MEWNYRKTYRAFTLWEMIIVMVITSFIVTLSYGAYQRFTDLLNADQENMKDLHDMVFLERDLLSLTASCRSIELVDDIIYFNGKDSYSYVRFSDSVMHYSSADWPEEREILIEDWSVIYLDDYSDYIKSFQIKCLKNSRNFNYIFAKVYPKSFLYSMHKE